MDLKRSFQTFILSILYQCLETKALDGSVNTGGVLSDHSKRSRAQDLHSNSLIQRNVLSALARTNPETKTKRFFEFSPLAFGQNIESFEDNSKRFFRISPFVSRPDKLKQLIKDPMHLRPYGSGYIIRHKVPAGLKPYVDHFSGVRSFALHLFKPKKNPKPRSIPDKYFAKERKSRPAGNIFLKKTFDSSPGIRKVLFSPGVSTRTPVKNQPTFYRPFPPGSLRITSYEKEIRTKDERIPHRQRSSLWSPFTAHNFDTKTEYKSDVPNEYKGDSLGMFNNGFGFTAESTKAAEEKTHKPDFGLFSDTAVNEDRFSTFGTFDSPSENIDTDFHEQNGGFGDFKTEHDPGMSYGLYDEELEEPQNGFSSFGSFSSDTVSILLSLHRIKPGVLTSLMKLTE